MEIHRNSIFKKALGVVASIVIFSVSEMYLFIFYAIVGILSCCSAKHAASKIFLLSVLVISQSIIGGIIYIFILNTWEKKMAFYFLYPVALITIIYLVLIVVG